MVKFFLDNVHRSIVHTGLRWEKPRTIPRKLQYRLLKVLMLPTIYFHIIFWIFSSLSSSIGFLSCSWSQSWIFTVFVKILDSHFSVLINMNGSPSQKMADSQNFISSKTSIQNYSSTRFPPDPSVKCNRNYKHRGSKIEKGLGEMGWEERKWWSIGEKIIKEKETETISMREDERKECDWQKQKEAGKERLDSQKQRYNCNQQKMNN